MKSFHVTAFGGDAVVAGSWLVDFDFSQDGRPPAHEGQFQRQRWRYHRREGQTLTA